MQVSDAKFPMLIELQAPNSERPDRFAPRKVHFVRCSSWPSYVAEAMMFPGRGVFNNGRWESMTRPVRE